MGVLICQYFDKLLSHVVRNVWWIFFAAVFVRILNVDVDCSYPLLKSMTAFLFMIGFAFKYPQLAIKKDISYGIYIYHMIFVNIAVQYGFVSSWESFISVIAMTLWFAWLSYEFIVKSTNKKKVDIIQSI